VTSRSSSDAAPAVPAPIYRKGLALKHEVAEQLASDYHSALIDQVRADDYQWRHGRLRLHLATEFGFCYGVDRAVDYAYQTRRRFPDRSIYLTGEIIHNPQVNHRLRTAGIRFLSDPDADANGLGAGDVVILPAFGVTISMLAQLQRQGCTLVDTTCGSVLNVWKNVLQYARDGYTAIIHGKVRHEETQATASQVFQYAEGRSLVVLDREEADLVCDFIRKGGDANAFMARFSGAVSPNFDPVRDLARVGLANQTTMLMSESLAIGDMIRQAMLDRYGSADLDAHYRAFDTICSATQDRQDAVTALLERRDLDLMIVIGGYNSSNTKNLARLACQRVTTYHIADASCLVSAREIRHRPVDGTTPTSSPSAEETLSSGWLPDGTLAVGLTAGASTPDSVVGQVIERLGQFAESVASE
jgi:4-hydroxy-3-methylbut-2-enyl diphosphate reductase